LEHLNGASLGWPPALLTKHYFILEKLARDKHSNLFLKFVNYDRKKFKTLAHGDQKISYDLIKIIVKSEVP
jgi:hypothetical protein